MLVFIHGGIATLLGIALGSVFSLVGSGKGFEDLFPLPYPLFFFFLGTSFFAWLYKEFSGGFLLPLVVSFLLKTLLFAFVFPLLFDSPRIFSYPSLLFLFGFSLMEVFYLHQVFFCALSHPPILRRAEEFSDLGGRK